MPCPPLRSFRRSSLPPIVATFLFAVPALAQDGEPRPMTAVRGAQAGSEVFISMARGRVAPGAQVSLGFGGLAGRGYEVLGRVTVGEDGVLATVVTVPAWAERNVVYFFFLNLGGGVRIFSDPFIVTGPGGELEVSGSVTEVEGGCVLLVQPDGTRYAVAGATPRVSVGSQVTFEGILGTLPDADPANSPCTGYPGIPVRVSATGNG